MAEADTGPLNRSPILLNHIVGFLLYLGAAGIGLEMALWQQYAPLIWPPAGLGVVFLLLGRLHLLPVIFLGALTVRLFEGGGVPDALIFGAAYSLTSYLSYLAVKRIQCTYEMIIQGLSQ